MRGTTAIAVLALLAWGAAARTAVAGTPAATDPPPAHSCGAPADAPDAPEPAPPTDDARRTTHDSPAPAPATPTDDARRPTDDTPAPAPVNQTVIHAPPPVSPDRTQDQVVVPGTRLRDAPQPNLLEALSQESAGLHVTRRGIGPQGVSNGAAGGLTIRGLGGSPNTQVLVVEDGVPDAQGIFGHPLPDAYVPDLLDEVVVVEGGDSVLYGSNAMGAAILLRSRWRDEDGLEATADTSYGSFGTLVGTATALGRTGGLDGAIALHGLKTDGHRDGAGGSDLVVQSAGRYRFAGGWSLALRNKAVHVAGADPGPIQHPTPDHAFDVWRDTLSATLAYDGPAVHVTVRPYANVGRHRLYDGFESRDWTVGGIAEATVRLHRRVDLLVGLDAQDVDGTVADRIAGTAQAVDARVDLAHYNQVTWRPVDGLSLVAGTRELYSLDHGFLFLFKAGFRWCIGRGFYVRSRVTRNHREPTMRELYLPYPVANPGLKPETSLNWDATAGWTSRHVDVSVTGFRTQAKDLIRYFGAWPAAEVVNVGRFVAWGVEGRLAVRDLGPFSASLSGQWQDVGHYTRQNPSAKVDATITLAHAFGPHRVQGSVQGEWEHGLYANDYHRNRMDDPYFVDVSLRYRYADPGRGWSLEPYLDLRNLLDTRYEYVPGYRMPGFNAMGGLKVAFGGGPP